MKYAATIGMLLLLADGTLRAQDPVFSQFYTSSMFLNPALSGLEKAAVFGLNYRTQWAGVDLPFKTFQFTATHPIIGQGIKAKQLGAFGGSVFTDEAGAHGEMVSQGVSVASSYDFHLDRTGNHVIVAALQLGILQRRVNADALQWSSQYSSFTGYDASLPGEPAMNEKATSPVVNAGFVWRLVIDNLLEPVRTYYQGVAFSNLNRPKGFFDGTHEPQSILVKIHGGYIHALHTGIEVSPNYLIQYQKTLQVNVGGYAAYQLPRVTSQTLSELKLSLGFWYRVNDSFIVTTGMDTYHWSAGLSYDANRSSLTRDFHGANAFEVSFSYRIHRGTEDKRFSTPLL